jgi:hypothetical protein
MRRATPFRLLIAVVLNDADALLLAVHTCCSSYKVTQCHISIACSQSYIGRRATDPTGS